MSAAAGPESILNWHRLDARITTSGQPTEAQLGILQSLGSRHVINLALHTHEQSLPDEAASLQALGIGYTHIPVAFRNPTAGDFTAFVSALEAHDTVPLHVHCIMNYRVSAFFYLYRRRILGWDAARALPDLEQIWQPDPVWKAFIAGEGAAG